MTIKGSNVGKVHTNSDGSLQSVDILLPSNLEFSRENTQQKEMHPSLRNFNLLWVSWTQKKTEGKVREVLAGATRASRAFSWVGFVKRQGY